jgi:hypothetical protein
MYHSFWFHFCFVLVQVPYEVLNKKFRAGQKTVDREVSHVQNSIQELEKSLFRSPVQVDQICSLIGVTVEKLQTMKRKVLINHTVINFCACYKIVIFHLYYSGPWVLVTG